MASLLQLFANGLVFGSVILLASVGLSLLYGIGNFANFAHGEFLTLGAYFTYAINTALGLPLVVAGGVSVVATGLLGGGLDRTLFKRHRDSPPIIMLIVTIGVALLLRSIVRIIWSNELRSFDQELTQGIQFVDAQFDVAGQAIYVGLNLTTDAIVIIVLGLVMALATHLFLTRTKSGIAMRATSDNADLAQVAGINTHNVLTITWILSGGLAALGGIFLGMQSGIILPRMGFNVVLVVFAAVVLGGIGSPYGAMIGAYIIGVAQEMSVAFPFVSPGYRFAVSFLIMIVVLLIKPKGIAGAKW